MADTTKIEWTDATWQVITGCSVVSPGCTNCYAMKLAGTRLKHHPSRKGLTDEVKPKLHVWNGQVRFNEQWLDQPLRKKKPRMIFVCAHGDLFHENVPDEWIDRVFAVMALAPQHTFQVLTKRPERMRRYMAGAAGRIANAAQPLRTDDNRVVGPLPHLEPGARWWPLPNVWLGVSVEDQKRANERIPPLLDTPAALRFISAEPLLGAVDLTNWLRGSYECGAECGYRSGHPPAREKCQRCGWSGPDAGEFCPECGHQDFGHLCPNCSSDVVHYHPDTPCLDWIIVGGESGPGSRLMHPDWVRSMRDQCATAGASFFFKQWGDWLPWAFGSPPDMHAQNGEWADANSLFPVDMDMDPNWDDGLNFSLDHEHFAFQRVGKKAAGAMIDGREYREMPEVRNA